ncbi:unnamed protein product, partial [Dibothriocephalus latus]
MTTVTQLTPPPPACSGGLIEFASYTGNANHSFVDVFVPCTLHEPSTWLLLVILLAVLLLTFTLLVSCCCSAVKNASVNSVLASTTSRGQLLEVEELEEGTGSEPSEQIELSDLEKLQQQRQQQQEVQLILVGATQPRPTKFSEKLLALLRHPFFAVIHVESKGLFTFLGLNRTNSARSDFPSLL